jgi:hypothetical protein
VEKLKVKGDEGQQKDCQAMLPPLAAGNPMGIDSKHD